MFQVQSLKNLLALLKKNVENCLERLEVDQASIGPVLDAGLAKERFIELKYKPDSKAPSFSPTGSGEFLLRLRVFEPKV
jgi:hypothetical protein